MVYKIPNAKKRLNCFSNIWLEVERKKAESEIEIRSKSGTLTSIQFKNTQKIGNDIIFFLFNFSSFFTRKKHEEIKKGMFGPCECCVNAFGDHLKEEPENRRQLIEATI